MKMSTFMLCYLLKLENMEPFTLFTTWYFTYGFVLVESLSLRICELTDGFDSFQMPQTSLYQSSPFGVFFRIKCINEMPCMIRSIMWISKIVGLTSHH